MVGIVSRSSSLDEDGAPKTDHAYFLFEARTASTIAS